MSNEPKNPGDAVPAVAEANFKYVSDAALEVGGKALTDSLIPAEPDPAKVARELAAAKEMQARMMWGIKRGVNPKDVGSLKALRDMNRKQRRAALAQAGKRVRKTRSAG